LTQTLAGCSCWFCSREKEAEPVILIERLRAVRLAFSPGLGYGLGAGERAWPWATGRFAGWAKDSKRNESVFLSFSSKCLFPEN